MLSELFGRLDTLSSVVSNSCGDVVAIKQGLVSWKKMLLLRLPLSRARLAKLPEQTRVNWLEPKACAQATSCFVTFISCVFASAGERDGIIVMVVSVTSSPVRRHPLPSEQVNFCNQAERQMSVANAEFAGIAAAIRELREGQLRTAREIEDLRREKQGRDSREGIPSLLL